MAGLHAYSVSLAEVTPEWLANVKRQHHCIVITGTGLGLELDTFDFENLSAAARRATLVAGVVPVFPPGRPRRRRAESSDG